MMPNSQARLRENSETSALRETESDSPSTDSEFPSTGSEHTSSSSQSSPTDIVKAILVLTRSKLPNEILAMIFAQDLKTHFRSYMTSSSPLLQALTTMSKSGNCTRLQLDLHTQALATWTRLSHFVTLPSDLLALDRRGYRQILAVKHLAFASMSFPTGQKITLKNELETICFDITRVERWRIKNTSHLLGLIIPAAIKGGELEYVAIRGDRVCPKTRRRCLDKWRMDSMDEMLGTKCTIVDYPEVPGGESKRLRDWIWRGPF